MLLTDQKITDQLAQFKYSDERLTLGYLRSLTRVRRRMQSMQMGGLIEDGFGGVKFDGDVIAMVEACDSQVAGKREALDRDVATWLSSAREEAKSLIAGAGPQTVDERLLSEQLKTNLRAELEPMFADGNGLAIVARFADMKRHQDSLSVRAGFDVCQVLDRQFPAALSYPGVDRTIIATAEPVERVSEATREAEALLTALDEAEAAWQAFIRRRGTQASIARGLLTNERLLDLATVFTDHSRSPLQQLSEGLPAEALLLQQGLVN